jgi:hypothetical protein
MTRCTLAALGPLIVCFVARDACAGVIISQPRIDGHADPRDFGQSFTPDTASVLSTVRLSVSASAGGSDATVRVSEFDRTSRTLAADVLSQSSFKESQLSSRSVSGSSCPAPEGVASGQFLSRFLCSLAENRKEIRKSSNKAA